MTNTGASRYGTPRASYRLQLHTSFGFEQARAIVPYLDALGISHLYLSPIFSATSGSTHGYDVVDHAIVNPELGGLRGLYKLSEELIRHNMGLIMDVVPNHVGIAGGANPWWRSVMRYGQASPYAGYFDIDWAAPHLPKATLLFPVLGESLGATLEAGNLRLGLRDGEIAICYYEQSFPVRPESYSQVLGLPPTELPGTLTHDSSLARFATGLGELSSGDYERCEAALPLLRTIVADEPVIGAYIQGVLDGWNGRVDEPKSSDRLEALLRSQHYLLADWRVAGSEINYRRFFDQNTLAAIRVEREDVFEATHRLVFDLVSRGIVTCVRVDHIDGLYNPSDYLRRLKSGLAKAAATVAGGEVPILVEKILANDERLPRDWPIAGTTGYEVIAHIDQLLVDAGSTDAMTRTYTSFIGMPSTFEQVRFDAKMQMADAAFAAEVSLLARRLGQIAGHYRLSRDIPLRWLHQAIESTIVCFPVYRTYVSEDDQGIGDAYIEAAIDEAHSRSPYIDESAFALLRHVLALDGLQPGSGEYEEAIAFRRRFQQVTTPLMAKGVEDTAFFRYNRLLSLNEVGNDPSRFGDKPAHTHAWFGIRANEWPGGMNASSTHDTKRNEDVRARLHTLSEFPREWAHEVEAWSRINERHKTPVGKDILPDRNLEYYLYQTLVGSWPDTGITGAYRDRLHEHLTKAMLEAKLSTSWAKRTPPYEAAAHTFLERLLATHGASEFQQSIQAFVATLQPVATVNSLSMLILKSLAPGFPDFYQGNEIYQLTLTDPDNRRPVDFAVRSHLLSKADASSLITNLADPEAKLWLTRRLLEIRRDHATDLAYPAYAPIETAGPEAEHLFAFSRGNGESLVVIAPRLVRTLLDAHGRIPPEAWSITKLSLPPGRWHNLLDDCMWPDGERRASVILQHSPFAVLVRS